MILALPACAWGQPDSVAAAFSDSQAGQSAALSVGEVPLRTSLSAAISHGGNYLRKRG